MEFDNHAKLPIFFKKKWNLTIMDCTRVPEEGLSEFPCLHINTMYYAEL